MKKLLLVCAIVSVILGVMSCKTSEANYRAAYDKASEAKQKADSDMNELYMDSTIYTEIRRAARHFTTTTSTGEEFPYVVEMIGTIPDDSIPKEAIRNYNVIVAQFKQLYNAHSLANRLKQNGYPGAFVVRTLEPLFYVVVSGASTPDESMEQLRKAQNEKNFNFNPPYPRVIAPAGRR